VIGLDEVEDLIQRALRLKGEGERDRAEALLHEALARQPGHPMAMTRLAEIDVDRKRHEAATERLQAVLRRHPNFAPAWPILAHASWLAGDPKRGLRQARRAVAIQPPNPDFRLVLAQFCVWLNHRDEVPDLVAPLIAPDQPDIGVRARALSMTGDMMVAGGEFAAADRWYEAALALVPDLVAARLAYGMNRLRQGDLVGGWRDYEIRSAISFFHPEGPPRRPGTPWTGEDPRGRVFLLEDDQGFGDSINFFRYVWPLREAGAARIVLKTFPTEVSLLQAAAPFVEVTATLPDDLTPDFYCMTGSLPYAFRTTLETIPGSAPYLHAPPLDEHPAMRLPVTGRPRVGLVWSGDRRHLRDQQRSIPARQFLRLADREGIEFVSLQAAVRPEDLPALEARPGISRVGEQVGDFADTAALIEQLDLVITVDTSVAHLAGALCKPVWIVLPVCPDFRWLTERSDSPWYPTARLLRSRAYGWGPVLRQVARALERWAGQAKNVPRRQ
jgi:tetratricopeptide (TPR) repeat protein